MILIPWHQNMYNVGQACQGKSVISAHSKILQHLSLIEALVASIVLLTQELDCSHSREEVGLIHVTTSQTSSMV